MEAAKEKILNISATAKSGMDKTKATAAEKVEKMKTSDPLQKEMAEQRKEEKIHQAELEKQQAYKANAIRTDEAHHTGVGHEAQGVGQQTGLGPGHQTGLASGLAGYHTGVGHEAQEVGQQTGLGGHHTGVGDQTGLTGLGHDSQGVGHQTGFGGQHTGVGHETGLGGHQTGVEQTGSEEPTSLYRTDGPTIGSETKVTGEGTGGGLY